MDTAKGYQSKLDLLKNISELGSQLNENEIEEGLAAQDQTTFLFASMAFLQQHVKRKLAEPPQPEPPPREPEIKKQRGYSNSLLFESCRRGNEKHFYIPLKNHEKFTSVMQSETCIPLYCALSKDQIIPKVKVSNKLRNLFSVKPRKPNQRSSILNLFRTSSKSNSVGSQLEQDDSTESIPHNWTSQIKNQFQQKRTGRIEKKQLKLLANLNTDKNNMAIKQSIHEHLRTRRDTSQDSLNTVDKFLVESPIFDDDSASDSNNYTYNTKKKSSRALSKISVCIDDESDSDTESMLTSREKSRQKSMESRPYSKSKLMYSEAEKEVESTSGYNVSNHPTRNYSAEAEVTRDARPTKLNPQTGHPLPHQVDGISEDLLKNILSDVIGCLEKIPSSKQVPSKKSSSKKSKKSKQKA